ncbi:ParA family protein [Jejubacter sp. L23]|uniref:ParA family protein n=1 Tax=Jejubacter sp. L23 TaxID=3092086 RepID=UPI003D734670
MKILPVISPKGGEGKSTFAAYLAGFCADAGLKTLLIDADWSQPTASSIFSLSEEAPFGLYELLMQMVPDPLQAISRASINNLDIVYSNDPDELLPTAMLHAADGRLRLRNILQNPSFSRYDLIIVDSKGATGVMTELSVLSSTGNVMGIVKPILPDVREFIRGSLHMFTRLKTYEIYGIHLPDISILINCIENTLLDREAMESLSNIISQKKYDSSALNTRAEWQHLTDLERGCVRTVEPFESVAQEDIRDIRVLLRILLPLGLFAELVRFGVARAVARPRIGEGRGGRAIIRWPEDSQGGKEEPHE